MASIVEVAPLTVPGKTIARQIVWLGVPVLVEQALQYLVGFSDTVLTGRYLAVEDLAAVTVCTYLFWFLSSLMMVVSAGATALVARLHGAGDRASANRIAEQAMGMALLIGTILLVFGWLNAPSLIRWIELEQSASGRAVIFLRVILLITPLLACQVVGIACLRGAGDTRTGMWIVILVNLVNASLSWSLVTGFLGMPRLGLRGVAIGTATGEGLGGALVLAILVKGRSGLKLQVREVRPQVDDIRRILRISLPAAIESLVNGLCQLWFLGLINQLGKTATAAHGVAIRCEALAFLTLIAFTVPAGTLTGQYLGAGRPDLAARAARTAWLLGSATIAVIGALLAWNAEAMFALFLGRTHPDVVAMGVPVLRIVAFALPALATIQILNGSLRGAGDTRWPLAIVLFGYLIVRMPLTYALALPVSQGGLGWGLRGAWIAMFCDLIVRGVLVAGRFFHGGWRWVRV